MHVSGPDLNFLWTDISEEYSRGEIGYYEDDSAEWGLVRHIYFTNNYYALNYAISRAIALSLFKKYKEGPEEFCRNYIAYLSKGSTPPEKLRRHFGSEIERELFEDAMDVVDLRSKQLREIDTA